MRPNRLIHKVIPIIAAALLCIACQPDTECRTEETVRCRIILSADSITAAGDTIILNSIDSVSAQGIGTDSIIYNNFKNIRQLSLPLRKDADTTQYALSLNQLHTTLTIIHLNTDYFVSLACGCFVYHTLTSAYTTSNDSITIIQPQINNAEQDNIYLHVHL